MKKKKYISISLLILIVICLIVGCLLAITMCNKKDNNTTSSSSSISTSDTSSSQPVIKKYTVTFKSDDQELKKVSVNENEYVSYDGEVTKSPVIKPYFDTGLTTKTEYVFSGWYTSKSFIDENKFDIEKTPITSDLVLYADYDETLYSEVKFVNYDDSVLKGKDSTHEAYYVQYNDKAIAPTSEPVRESVLNEDGTTTYYSFKGWPLLTNIIVPTIFKAEFIEGDNNSCYVTFYDANKNEFATKKVAKGSKIGEFTSPTSCDEYITSLAGLRTKKTYSDFNCWIDNEGSEFDLESTITSSLVLTAKYDKVETYHEVKFVDDDRTTILKPAYFVKEGEDAIAPDDPKKDSSTTDDYIFDGWNKSLTNISEPTLFVAVYSVSNKPKVSIVNSMTNEVLKTYIVDKNTSLSSSQLLEYTDTLVWNDPTNKKVTYWEWETSDSERNKPITKNTTFYIGIYTISYDRNGVYPQTKVTDSTLISKIDAAIANNTIDSLGYYLVEGNSYYKEGSTYRKVEPIKWIKISGTYKTGATMIAEKVLLNKEYYSKNDIRTTARDYKGISSTTSIYANNYQFSDIRTYLNTEFLTKSFNDSSLLVETTIKNSADTTNSTTNPYVANDTADKVWLLSYKDAVEQFNSGDNSIAYNIDGQASKWRLRSPSASDANKVFISSDEGYVNKDTTVNVNENIGIRPVIQFNAKLKNLDEHSVSFYDGSEKLKESIVYDGEYAYYSNDTSKADKITIDSTTSLNSKVIYKFVGWYTSKTFEESSKFNLNATTVTTDLNLYAKYDETRYYEVKFVDDDETTVLKGATYVKEGEKATSPVTPTKAMKETSSGNIYYTFKEWSPSISTSVSKPTIYKATYDEVKKEVYTVSFKNANGDHWSSMTVESGKTVGTVNNPSGAENIETVDSTTGLKTKTSFSGNFLGWVDASGNIFSLDTAITSDITLTAKYATTQTFYEVKFVDEDGITQLKEPTYVKSGNNAIAPSSPTKESDDDYDYTFTGWNKDLTNITAPTIFTAVYSSAKKCTVTIVDNSTSAVISSFKISKNTSVSSSKYDEIFNSLSWADSTNKTVTYREWVDSEIVRTAAISEDKTFGIDTYTISYDQNGVYPQTKVTDSTLISKIDAAIANNTKDSLGYYLVEGNSYYKEGSTYRKVEPIKWIKISGTYKTGATMIAEKVLFNMNYHSSTDFRSTATDYNNTSDNDVFANNYKYSYIRTYLNTDFISSAYVDSSVLTNSWFINGTSSTDSSDNPYTTVNTSDKVGLFSYSDANYYYSSSKDRIFYDRDGLASSWWLRSPSNSGETLANSVDSSGNIVSSTVTTSLGIRPCITFNAGLIPVPVTYTVEFRNANNTTVSTKTVESGKTVTPSKTPSTCEDKITSNTDGLWTKNTYGGGFKCWVDSEGNEFNLSTPITSNMILTAKYNTEITYYEVKFVDEDGNTILKGRDSSTGSAYYVQNGDTAIAPSNPKKAADGTYTYTFAGWDKDLTNVSAPTIFKATYNAVRNKALVSVVDQTTSKTLGSFEIEKGTSGAAEALKIANSKITWDNSSDETVTYWDWITSDEDRNANIKADETTFYLATYTISYAANGLWPQTEVTDAMLIADIENAISENNVDSLGYYVVDGDSYYKDVDIYRKVEPIKWIKLSGNYKDGAILMAEKALIKKQYYSSLETRTTATDYKGDTLTGTIYANNYKFSDIRTYLNTEFIAKAFGTDTSYLVETTVDNSIESTYNAADDYVDYICENTLDKVWLLSFNDVKTNPRSKVYDVDGNETTWWLRSPYDDQAYASNGKANGAVQVDLTSTSSVNLEYGIVPVIQFKIVV